MMLPFQEAGRCSPTDNGSEKIAFGRLVSAADRPRCTADRRETIEPTRGLESAVRLLSVREQVLWNTTSTPWPSRPASSPCTVRRAGRRAALDKDRLPIYRGNMTPVSSLDLRCQVCGEKERFTACDDTRWVCEAHPDRPWDGSTRDCTCGGAGMPCPACNTSNPPEPLPGFRVTIDASKGPRH